MHPYSCAEDLGRILGKTRANIQHHLKAMEQANMISRVSISQSSPVRGRPRAYFSLAQVKRPNNISSLTEVLLNILLEHAKEEDYLPILEEIARQILQPGGPSATLTQRLNRTAKELTRLGYQARWEAHAGGPEVVFRNCPYHPLPDKYPVLCRMDALLLKQNLGVPEPTQIARVSIPLINTCRFSIKEI